MSVDHGAELAALEGQSVGPPQIGREIVNAPMIRHWVEAMGDRNPVYTSPEAAAAAGLGDVIAPPTMLQTWTMAGLEATLARERRRAEGLAVDAGSAFDQMLAMLDDEGRTSVVATNSQQHYVRPLRLGERLVMATTIESVTPPKRTALGEGRFVTTRMEFRSMADPSATADPQAAFDTGDPVATMRWSILKFAPKERPPERPLRPRPAITEDNAFFFQGLRDGKLLIQRCSTCGTLRHPPMPACGACRSFDWEPVEASGRGVVFSFVVVHYPQVPAFEYPLPIGLIALEEGTRLVADLHQVAVDDIHVGMAVVADLVRLDAELTLPFFRPA